MSDTSQISFMEVNGTIVFFNEAEAVCDLDAPEPEQLPEKLEWIPCYYTETGTEDRNEEAVTIWLMQP